MKSGLSRRGFIKKAVCAGAVIGFPTIVPATVLARSGKASPNSKVNVALIGCGDRSSYAFNYKNYDKSVRSDILCHLIDISARTGRKIEWNPAKETIVGDKQAEEMMHREMRKPWTL